MGIEWKKRPLPRRHPVLGHRKVKEVTAVTVVLGTRDTPDLGPASSGFALAAFLPLPTFILRTPSSPLGSLLLITKKMHRKCHLLRKTVPDTQSEIPHPLSLRHTLSCLPGRKAGGSAQLSIPAQAWPLVGRTLQDKEGRKAGGRRGGRGEGGRKPNP